MQIYSFSVHNADSGAREHTGRMALSDENAARAFGKAMMRDMMRDGPKPYVGWILNVARGNRIVCSIPFPGTSARVQTASRDRSPLSTSPPEALLPSPELAE